MGGTAAVLEQLHIDLALEIANLPRQRGLRDSEARGGSGKRAFFGDGREIPEMTEIHDCVISTRRQQPDLANVGAMTREA
jgi:hypothetical protein